MKNTYKNSLCIFCFKPPVSVSRKDNFDKKRMFLKLFSRYLELNIKSENFVNSNELVSCEDCFFLEESFCDLYFQLESIKLQLNWKARKIFDTVRFAGKVSSRCSAFINQFADDDESDRVLNTIQGVRRNLLKQCTKKMKSAFPKVLLNRIPTNALSQKHTESKKPSPDENFQTDTSGSLPMNLDNCKESLNQVQDDDKDKKIEKTSEPDIGYSEVVVMEDGVEIESDGSDDEILFTPSEEVSTIYNEGFQRDPLETEPVKSLRSLLQCPECTMTFTYQTALNFHLKLHKGFERRTESERLRTNNVDANFEISRGMGINIISEKDARQASEAIPVSHQCHFTTYINKNNPELHSIPATSEVKVIVESGNSQELGQADNPSVASCSQPSSSSTQQKPKTVYKCTPCNMHFDAGSQFLHHMFWAHGRVFRLKYSSTSTSSSTVPTNGLYVCPELKCMVHCPTKPELLEHIWTHTKEKAVASGQESIESLPIADFDSDLIGFQPQPEYETIVNTVPSSVTASESQQLGSDYVSFFHHRSEKSRNNHYVCSHCPFQTMNNTEIHQHVKIHLKGSKPRPKTKCKPSTAKSLPSSSRAPISTSILINNLRTKSVTKHPKKYKCDVEGCGKAYTQNNRLKIHRRIHIKNPYKCYWEGCPWTFAKIGELTHHYKKHTIPKPFQCKHCYKSFSRSDHLARHMKLHEKLFST